MQESRFVCFLEGNRVSSRTDTVVELFSCEDQDSTNGKRPVLS